VVAPRHLESLRRPGIRIEEREFSAVRLDGKWFAVAAARRSEPGSGARGGRAQVFVNAVTTPIPPARISAVC